MLLKIAELYPNHSTVHVQLGQAYEALGKREEAKSAYLRAIGLSPFHPALHCTLAKLLERSEQGGRHSRAWELQAAFAERR